MKPPIILGCLLLVSLVGCRDLEKHHEKNHEAVFEYNFRFEGDVVDDQGLPLEDVHMYVRELVPSGWEGGFRVTKSIVSENYQFEAEGVTIVSFEFTKEGYYPFLYSISVLKGLPDDMQPGGDKFIYNKNVILRKYPDSFPDLAVSSRSDLHFRTVPFPSSSIFVFANEENANSRSGYRKIFESTTPTSPNAPHLMMILEEDSTVEAVKQHHFYCTPDQTRIVIELKGLENLDTEFWGEDDIADGMYLEFASVDTAFKALSRMHEAPVGGYSTSIELPLANFDACEGNAHAYLYLNVGGKFGKVALISPSHQTNTSGEIEQIEVSYKVFVNKNPGDRNVATKKHFDIP